MASIVPIGMLFLAFLRSPDMFTPAVKPVTAGKKMPNSTAIGAACFGATAGPAPATGVQDPRNTLISESTIASRIRYCVLIANSVLISVTVVSSTRTTLPQIRIAEGVSPMCR